MVLAESRPDNSEGYAQSDIVNLKKIDHKKKVQIKQNPAVKTQIFGNIVKNEMKLYTENRNSQSKNIFTQINQIQNNNSPD